MPDAFSRLDDILIGIEMNFSEIRSLYRDENDLFQTVIKRIYEEWNEVPMIRE